MIARKNIAHKSSTLSCVKGGKLGITGIVGNTCAGEKKSVGLYKQFRGNQKQYGSVAERDRPSKLI